MNATPARTRCRALVAGFGRPGMRDLDFGRQLIRYLDGLSWDEGVVVEDLSYAAPLVLHRLQELEPAKVVLVGAVARGFEAPGSLRRQRLDAAPPSSREVQRSLEESVQGVVDIDHTLAVARHYGALPAETVIIEIEPADCSFGLGFSEELGRSFEAIVAMVQEELGCAGEEPVHADLDQAVAPSPLEAPTTASTEADEKEPSAELAALIRYAGDYRQARLVEPHRGATLIDERLGRDGLAVAGRCRAWGLDVAGGGDFFDVVPLDGGWYGCVIGDVGARGVQATAAMADLRASARAYALSDGRSPRRVLGRLDHLARAIGVGAAATLVYVAVQPATGEARLANAGHCPPLLLTSEGKADFLRMAAGGALGTSSAGERRQARLVLGPGSTLVLFTDGLVQRPMGATEDHLEHLRRTAARGPSDPRELCDRLFEVRMSDVRRDDDMALLVLRLETNGELAASA